VRRRLLRLVLAVLVVHALFVAGFYLFRLAHASPPLKLGYTAAWTAITLLVVLRGLIRVRALRSRDAGHEGFPRG
jgi:hypothetical protein